MVLFIGKARRIVIGDVIVVAIALRTKHIRGSSWSVVRSQY